MGRVTGGAFGTFIGKVGYVVGYIRLGQSYVRNAPIKSKKPRTPGQRGVNQKFELVRKFISDTKEFINVGFRSAALGTGKTAQNVGTSWNLKQAIVGEHPKFKLDYSQILVSKGDLPVAIAPIVEYVHPNLKFKWTVDPGQELIYERDQVMMLAYHPKNAKTFSVLSGNRRKFGEDELCVINLAHPRVLSADSDFVETYIAFISDDRNEISDSVYVGRVYLA